MSYYESPAPMPQAKTNTMAIISLIAGILGVLALLSSLCLPCTLFISLITGPLGAILGFLGKKRINESQGAETGQGMAIAGIVTGLVAAGGTILAFILYLFIFGISLAPAFLIPFLEGGNF